MTKKRHDDDDGDAVARLMARREWLRKAATGTAVVALGGAAWYVLDDDLTRKARAQVREDGRPRLPPGQRVLLALKPMGGDPGDPSPGNWRLRVHGDCAAPYELTFAELLAMKTVESDLDVHCVTGWSVLGARWKGVPIKALAERAQVNASARHVVFEAAHGYTANARIDEALDGKNLVAWELDGQPLPRRHGAPVRAVVPDLYFWKSPKWLTGIRFVQRDAPGYWEVRGYHNHADPWREERYG